MLLFTRANRLVSLRTVNIDQGRCVVLTDLVLLLPHPGQWYQARWTDSCCWAKSRASGQESELLFHPPELCLCFCDQPVIVSSRHLSPPRPACVFAPRGIRDIRACHLDSGASRGVALGTTELHCRVPSSVGGSRPQERRRVAEENPRNSNPAATTPRRRRSEAQRQHKGQRQPKIQKHKKQHHEAASHGS